MNIKIVGLIVLVNSCVQAQKLLVKNMTPNRLNIHISSWIKSDPTSNETVHTKKIELFPGKTEELGDTKTTMITEISVGSLKNVLASRPTIDMASLSKALSKARRYRNGAITLLFNKEPKGKKIYVTARSEKEMRDLPTDIRPS